MMIFKLAWRNIWRNRRRTIITTAAICIAVILALLMRALQLGMYDNMIENVVGKFTGYIQVHANGYWDERNLDNTFVYTDSTEKNLQNIEDIKGIVPRLETFALSSGGDLTKGVFITGVIPEKENILKDFSSSIEEGKMFDPAKHQILIGKGLAKYYNMGPGDTLVFIGQGYHGSSAAGKYEISGIVNLNNPNLNKLYVFSDIETVREFCGGDQITSTLVIAKEKKADEKKIAAAIRKKLSDEDYEVMTWHEMVPEIQQAIQADSVGGIIFISILYMIISFGIFGTILMMTQERMFEFGVLISIGMARVKIIRIMLLESLILALLGVLAGLVVAMPIIQYFHVNPLNFGAEQSEMMEKYGFNADIPFWNGIDLPLTHGLIILGLTLVMSLYPVFVIRKLNPLKAMKK